MFFVMSLGFLRPRYSSTSGSKTTSHIALAIDELLNVIWPKVDAGHLRNAVACVEAEVIGLLADCGTVFEKDIVQGEQWRRVAVAAGLQQLELAKLLDRALLDARDGVNMDAGIRCLLPHFEHLAAKALT